MMKLVILVILIGVVHASQGNYNPQSHGGYRGHNDNKQNGYYYDNQPPPPQYPYRGYGQPIPQPPPPPQSDGILTKLKSSIFAASSAISDSLTMGGQEDSPPYGMPPPPYSRENRPAPSQGMRPPPGYPQDPSRPAHAPPGYPSGFNPQFPPPQQQQPESGGLFGKLKTLFGSDENSELPPQRQQPYGNAGPSYSRSFPPPPGSGSNMYGSSGGVDNSRNSGFPPTQSAAPHSQQHQQFHPSQGFQPPSSSSQRPEQWRSPSSGEVGTHAKDFQQQQQPYPWVNQHVSPYQQEQNQPMLEIMSESPLMEPQMEEVSTEPQVFIHADSIVMVLKPRELNRKKRAFQRAGPSNFQVFMDFEHVVTGFKTEAGERAVGSAELLENSGAVHMKATEQLSVIAEDFDNVEYMDEAAFEDLTKRCQDVVARDGALHIASVAPVTRDLMSKLGLRKGWQKAIKSLSSAGVPTYVFSSGYGDVVAQVILQGLQDKKAGDGSTAGGGGHLPQNTRIVSNFFRTAPDGTVRAFSKPIVHERNKNSSTAAAQMGFALPSRPYALVLGSHEDDVGMTESIEGLEEQINVGYLELSEDLPQRLPLYLSSFDAVVIGDGSFEFPSGLIDELIGLSQQTSGQSDSSGQAGSTAVGGLALGLRNKLGMFLSSGNQQAQPQQFNPPTQYRPQQPYQQQQQYQPYQQSQQGHAPPPQQHQQNSYSESHPSQPPPPQQNPYGGFGAPPQNHYPQQQQQQSDVLKQQDPNAPELRSYQDFSDF